ncbi:MAG TPA: putative toxin-antitoxin system toxin component, PIN family [Longimicrobium sp.]|nr:putative toxin-antitoxin system toxin component, PIN family [Longimicrobium sp.]
MKVLLDTNILIAAFVAARGRSAEILERCANEHEIITSRVLLEEYREKLVRKFRLSAELADTRISLFESQAHVVEPTPLPQSVCRDPDDDHVLAAAIAGGCRCIVTGDNDLLVLRRYETVDIISPSEFDGYESATL